MKIFLIWASDGNPQQNIGLVDAWDADTIEENREGWEDTLAKAYEDHGPANVRVTTTDVNFDRVQLAFEPFEV